MNNNPQKIVYLKRDDEKNKPQLELMRSTVWAAMSQILQTTNACFKVNVQGMEDWMRFPIAFHYDEGYVNIFPNTTLKHQHVPIKQFDMDYILDVNAGIKKFIQVYDGWISIKKSLPPMDAVVLVVGKFIQPYVVVRHKDPKTKIEGFYITIPRGKDIVLAEVKNVTHWMALPEIPENLLRKL